MKCTDKEELRPLTEEIVKTAYGIINAVIPAQSDKDDEGNSDELTPEELSEITENILNDSAGLVKQK